MEASTQQQEHPNTANRAHIPEVILCLNFNVQVIYETTGTDEECVYLFSSHFSSSKGLNTPSFFFVASLTNVTHEKNKGHNVRTKSAA